MRFYFTFVTLYAINKAVLGLNIAQDAIFCAICT